MTVYWISPNEQFLNEGHQTAIGVSAETTNDPSSNYGQTYEIIGGADGALFQAGAGITGRPEFFPNGADFEHPLDANRDNIYEVIVRATAYWSDGQDLFSEQGNRTFLLEIKNTNDTAPTAGDDTAAVLEDASVSGNVLGNDTDLDGLPGHTVTYVANAQGAGMVVETGGVSVGQYGVLRIQSDGSYTYTADLANGLSLGQTGTDTFLYTMRDGLFSDEAVLTITVSGLNEPVISTEGNDTLTGGRDSTSQDIFVFDAGLKKNVDRITDFERAYDQIFLDDAFFKGLGKGTPDGTPLKKAMFAANKDGEATSDDAQIVYETDTGKLFYDADGEGGKKAAQFAVLEGKPRITNLDFEII